MAKFHSLVFRCMPLDDIGEIDVSLIGFGPTGQGVLDLDHIRVVKFATYAITYHANGATSGGVPASQTKTNGFPLILAANSGNLSKGRNGWPGPTRPRPPQLCGSKGWRG